MGYKVFRYTGVLKIKGDFFKTFDQKSKFSHTAFRGPKGVIKNIFKTSNLFQKRQERD